MEKSRKNMEEICTWLERVASWVSYSTALPIDYIGHAYDRFNNPPLPLLELCFVSRGAYPDLQVGTRHISLSLHELSLHTVQFGNYGQGAPGSRCWCLFLDITGVRAFAPFLQEPLAFTMAVHSAERLTRAYEAALQRLRQHCRMPDCGPEPLPYTMAHGKRPSMFTSWSIKAAVLELLATLIEDAGRGQARDESVPAAIQAVQAHVADHFQEPSLNLGTLAGVACLSVAHFSRVFGAQTGTSPMQYVATTRIEESRYLLERSELRIKEVAREVGFADPLHFSRVFRQHMGLSPRLYRHRYRTAAH